MFLKKRLCFVMVMILMIVTVFMGRSMTVKADEGDITITVTGNTNGVAEIGIGNSKIQDPFDQGITGGTLKGEKDSQGRNVISILPTFGYAFTKIIVNGSDYSGDIGNEDPATRIEVSGANAYTIDVEARASSQKTIVWAYDDAFGPDAKVENGKVKVVSVNGSNLDNENAASGHVIAREGETVVVELIPEYGYQVGGVQLNGGATLTPQEDVSTFEFTMPDTNLHFKGIFEPASDKVTNGAASIVRNVSIGNGNAIAGNSGNAEVILDNANTNVTSLPAGASLAFGEERDTSRNMKSVNIATRQIVSKGNGTYWETPQTDLSESVELALTVDTGATGYAVFREHNGIYDEIDSWYDPVTGSLIFASDRFSTYTFVPLTTENNKYAPQYDYNGGGSWTPSDVHESGSSVHAHTHNYEWQTITDPSAEQDGLEAYACTICGFYEESVPVSAYSYACTDAAKKVFTAKQNDTLVLKMGRWNSYPKWFMEKLASRSDLTIQLQFEYQHKQYELTIPAGVKIETECDWYGPLKLCTLYEYTVN